MSRVVCAAAVLAGCVLAAVAQPPAEKRTPDKKSDKTDKTHRLSPAAIEILKSTPQEFIRRYDKNKDGYLSREEVPERVAVYFDDLDVNHDGKLGVKEVEQLLIRARKRFHVDETKADAGPKDEAAERQVARWLALLDHNKDGKLSRDEAQGRLKENFSKFDANKDGYLDKDELRRLAVQLAGSQAATPPETKRQALDFDSLDRNADGRLTRDELMGTPLYEHFKEIDTNHDNRITPQEFRAYLKKQAANQAKSPEKK